MKLPETFPHEVTVDSVSVTVYQHKRTIKGADYLSYTLAYRQDGQRKREVLGGDYDRAEKRAKEIAGSIAQNGAKAVPMSQADCEAYANSLRLIKDTGMTLEAVCKEYAEAHRLAPGATLLNIVREHVSRHGQIMERKLVPAVVGEFLDAKRAGKATKIGAEAKRVSEKYLYQTERRLEAFAAAFPTYIDSIPGEEINRWIDGLKRKGTKKAVGGITKNNYIESINLLYEFARLKKYIARDHRLDEIQAAAEEDFTIEIYTPEEFAKLLKHSAPALTPFIAISGLAGLRSSEIQRLDWSDVNLDAGRILVRGKNESKTKRTRSRRLVPVCDRLKSILAPIAKKHGAVWALHEQTLYDHTEATARAAGMKWKKNALRHSYISYRLAEVENSHKVGLECDNSERMIFEHYRELVTKEQATAWFSAQAVA